MAHATLQLRPLTCPSCVQKIQGTLDKVTGVTEAKVLFNAAKVKVAYDDQTVTLDDIRQTIQNLGFDIID